LLKTPLPKHKIGSDEIQMMGLVEDPGKLANANPFDRAFHRRDD
jgi:hypothetical protein